jgi:hypothetical protein
MSKDNPSIILLMDATRKKILDSVAIEYEDPLSLESFGEAVKTAESAEPMGNNNLFPSFYFHILYLQLLHVDL